MAITNIVLVHGAFVDGSGWQGVYDHLAADGYRVAVVQIPTLSQAGDVAATHEILGGLDGRAVLVGHSYGGAVITEAGNARRSWLKDLDWRGTDRTDPYYNHKITSVEQEVLMTTLLALEPRDAGASVIEPDIEFDSELDALRTRTRCHGCCTESSHHIIITGTLVQ